MTQKFPRKISVIHFKKKRHFFNCSSHAIIDVLQYQTLFSLQQRREGAIVIHSLVCLYCFGALAILCDHYFCASLEKLCRRLRIPTDVAGATFMAAGSSMPTLFIAIASVFMGEGDIGLGTIIGSTMFNILFISAICGLCSGMAIALRMWPLLRDSFAYTVHLIALLIAIEDNIVHWYEAVVFPFLYSGYILVMCYNKKLENLFEKVCKRFCEIRKGFEMLEMDDPLENEDKEARRRDTEETSKAEKLENTENDVEQNAEKTEIEEREKSDFDRTSSQIHGFEAKSPFEIPKSSFKLVYWVVMLPVHVLFFITMPDCRRKGWENWYPVTFVVSILWMALISYVLVWTVSVIGETFDIPECIMGLTLLAAGSSVPDAVASLVVAKHGMGDMALANCVGSNIFDILCLGLPWFLAATVVHPGSVVLIHSGHVVYTSLCLFGTVFVTLLVIHLNHWNLDKRSGYMLLVIYLLFLSAAVILEALPGGDAPKLNPHHPGHLPNKGLGHHKNAPFKKVT
ncbi:sodium/potassium/calcium exchanger 5-like [Montipora foliosa]|uniref:sodium/potassium/calcium exchanger 5-like n=1 Tax=Montipora foliosa TaxID=591990 RepID=UPI0035F1E569